MHLPVDRQSTGFILAFKLDLIQNTGKILLSEIYPLPIWDEICPLPCLPETNKELISVKNKI